MFSGKSVVQSHHSVGRLCRAVYSGAQDAPQVLCSVHVCAQAVPLPRSRPVFAAVCGLAPFALMCPCCVVYRVLLNLGFRWRRERKKI
jgi:hypothetical protein